MFFCLFTGKKTGKKTDALACIVGRSIGRVGVVFDRCSEGSILVSDPVDVGEGVVKVVLKQGDAKEVQLLVVPANSAVPLGVYNATVKPLVAAADDAAADVGSGVSKTYWVVILQLGAPRDSARSELVEGIYSESVRKEAHEIAMQLIAVRRTVLVPFLENMSNKFILLMNLDALATTTTTTTTTTTNKKNNDDNKTRKTQARMVVPSECLLSADKLRKQQDVLIKLKKMVKRRDQIVKTPLPQVLSPLAVPVCMPATTCIGHLRSGGKKIMASIQAWMTEEKARAAAGVAEVAEDDVVVGTRSSSPESPAGSEESPAGSEESPAGSEESPGGSEESEELRIRAIIEKKLVLTYKMSPAQATKDMDTFLFRSSAGTTTKMMMRVGNKRRRCESASGLSDSRFTMVHEWKYMLSPNEDSITCAEWKESYTIDDL